MRYCVKCGEKVVDDDLRFCPHCGEEIPFVFESERSGDGGQSYTYGQTDNGQSYTYEQTDNGQNYTYSQPDNYQSYAYDKDYFNPSEVKKNKGMGVLSYLGILVLIPLLAGDKMSEYVKLHVNQGLILFILNTIIEIITGDWTSHLYRISYFSNTIDIVFNIFDFALFILAIMGIISACKGEKKELPLIGRVKIIK